jgi:16S rRNA (cytosine967-C5)-methyltransferase
VPSARELAITALEEVFSRGRKPRAVIERLSAGLERRDRAFLMELCYGVLRHRDLLDWVLGKFLEKPRRLGRYTTQNLRAGVYQILFMRVPGWAAVNEAVRIEKKNTALVNAVLRNVLRLRPDIEKELREMEEAVERGPKAISEASSRIALLTSHPVWLARRWVRRFGPGDALRLARANNEVPPLTLRVNTLRAGRDDVLERLRAGGVEAGAAPHSPDGVILKGGVYAFRELPGLEGLVLVQDEAAQLLSRMLGPQPGERVLDACSAPGGKATHMAQLMGDEGEVVAVEKEEKRIALLEENIRAMGLESVRVVHGDITGLSKTGALGTFHRAMVDAPCSSLGVIRRNPDVKYRHRAHDLPGFRASQLEILASSAALVRPGGTVLYATCSTEPEEGEDVVGKFLKTHGDFYIIKDASAQGSLAEDGFWRTYPHIHGMDGFFAALLGRRS